MTRSLPRPQDQVRQLARPGEADEGAQLERVVGGREQVGRAADAHRREPRQRLVARRLDPDPALDVGAGRERVEGRRSSAALAAREPLDRGRLRQRAAGPPRPGPARRPRRPRPAGRARGPRRTSRRARPGRRGARPRRAARRRRTPRRRRAGPRPPRPGSRRWPAGGRRRADTARRPSAGRGRSPRPASTSRRDRRPGPRRRARPASRRAGTGTAGSGRAARPGRRLAAGQRRRIAVVAGHVDDRHPLDEPGQRLGDRGVEAADRLRAAEDEEHALVRRRRRAAAAAATRSDRRDVADRRPGHVARATRRAPASVRQVASNETASAAASRAVARTARPGMTLPSHMTTGMPSGAAAIRTGHGDVAAGREDRGRPLRGRGSRSPAARTAPRRIGSRTAWTSASVVRSERSGEPAQRDARRRDERRLEAAVAAEPAQLRRRRRSSAERPGDGERRVDVSARPAGRDQQSHRRSTSPFPRSRARSTAGSRPPRS